MKLAAKIIAAGLLVSANAALAGETPAPEGASVYFVNLKDGDVVESPVKVIFGLSGMGVAPAGVDAEHTGHHHLFINRAPLGEGPAGKEELEYGIPADDKHKHFGKGQTEAVLDLPAGTHTLQLVLGDLDHIPHATPVASDRITITVK